jgi:hypothetical protein
MFSGQLLRGRRRLRNLQIAALLWSAGLLAIALAPGAGSLVIALLFAAVLVWSLGEAVYAPSADALPASLAPTTLLGRYAALHQMAWGVSEVIAPTLVATLLALGTTTAWLALGFTAAVAALAYRAAEAVVQGRDGVAGVAA